MLVCIWLAISLHDGPAARSVKAADFNDVWDLARHPEQLSSVYRWNGNGEHFYTTDRAGEAAASRGYVKETAAFAVSAVRRDGMIPIYRLQRGAHLYTKSGKERADALTKGFADEGVLGYIFANPAPGLIALHSWRDSRTGSRFLSAARDAEGPAIEKSGSRYEGIVGYVFPNAQPQRVGVYYFGMFSPRAFESGQSWVRDNIRRFYGAEDSDQFWWAGVRDLFAGNASAELIRAFPDAAEYFNADWSHLKPAIGWYDQSDPRTLERHINQAISNGVSYFNFYWYWDFLLDGEGLNDGLDSFLRARNGDKLDFMISICEHGWHFSMSKADFAKVARLIVAKYLSRENYLKTKDGRLILEICDANGIRTEADPRKPQAFPAPDVAALREFVGDLRKDSKRVLDRDLLIVGTGSPETIASAGLDGGTCVTSLGDHPEIGQIPPSLMHWLDMAAGRGAYLPCITEHFDERPRAGILKPPAQILFDGGEPSPSAFKAELSEAKGWMDERPADELSRFVTLYAWNEWHEGGILEPNFRDGAALIAQIPDVFKTPFMPLPCRRTGICPDASGAL